MDAEPVTDVKKRSPQASWMAGRIGLNLGPATAVAGIGPATAGGAGAGVGPSAAGAYSGDFSQSAASWSPDAAPAAGQGREADRAPSWIKPLIDHIRDNRYLMLAGSVVLVALIWGYSALFSRGTRARNSGRKASN